MSKAFLLTDADREVLMRLIDRERNSTRNTRGRNDPSDYVTESPDLLMARTPGGGIPAIVAGTGIGSGPQYADCNVYRIVPGNGNPPSMRQFTGIQKRVWNPSDADVPGNMFILISLDNFGYWVPIYPGGLPTIPLPPGAYRAVNVLDGIIQLTGITGGVPTATNGTCLVLYYHDASEFLISFNDGGEGASILLTPTLFSVGNSAGSSFQVNLPLPFGRPFVLSNTDFGYSPSTPGNWSGLPPDNAASALDRIAAWIQANGGGPLP